jgi:hypothetical protein
LGDGPRRGFSGRSSVDGEDDDVSNTVVSYLRCSTSWARRGSRSAASGVITGVRAVDALMPPAVLGADIGPTVIVVAGKAFAPIGATRAETGRESGIHPRKVTT